MATQTIITDDLDGKGDALTRTFSVGGTAYEIDLTDANYDKLQAALAPFIDAGRPAAADPLDRLRGNRASRAARARRTSFNLADVRQWAKDNGHDVSDRGRIAADVQQAYDEAHK